MISDEEHPFSVEEVIKVCRGMQVGESFHSPPMWPMDIFCYPGPSWMLLCKNEGTAIERNTIAIETADLGELEKALNDHDYKRVTNWPYVKEFKV
jgi:hypothetical protein